MLANIYLKNFDYAANVFLPRYNLTFLNSRQETNTVSDYFLEQNNENNKCIFISGGVFNLWEKNIEYINKAFFDTSIKIIRMEWSEKYLKDGLAEKFKGKENKLHSEIYYDLFFRSFFINQLKK